MKRDELAQLTALAEIRADRSASRLVRLQTAIDALEAKAASLRNPCEEAPGSIADAVMHDRWNRWRSEQIRLLNARILRLQVVAQPLREAQARDTARAKVLEKLAKPARR